MKRLFKMSTGSRSSRYTSRKRGMSRLGTHEPMYEPMSWRSSATTESAEIRSSLSGFGGRPSPYGRPYAWRRMPAPVPSRRRPPRTRPTAPPPVRSRRAETGSTFRGVDHVGRPRLLGQIQFVLQRVHRDDRVRARQLQSHHDAQPNAAHANGTAVEVPG